MQLTKCIHDAKLHKMVIVKTDEYCHEIVFKRITHKGKFFSSDKLSDGIRHLSSALILVT